MDEDINDDGRRNDSRNGIENDHLEGQAMTTKTTEGAANNNGDEEAANSK